jgi:hypothetical protein
MKSLSENEEYASAFNRLHELYSQRSSLESRLTAAASPAAAKQRRDRAASAMLVGATAPTATAGIQCLEESPADLQEQLDIVVRAAAMQEEIVRKIRVRLSARANAELVATQRALLTTARTQAHALAVTCRKLDRLYAEPEDAGFDATGDLERVNLPRSVWDQTDPLYPDATSTLVRFVEATDALLKATVKELGIVR